MTAIRERVGDDFLVGVRMVCDEDWDRGLSREEGVSIAERLAATGLIDFVNVIRGHIDTDEALSHVIPGMGARSAPHLDFSGEVRAATRMPTFHAARIQDVATARHAIESGKLDMVGMTRAHLADPHIARKVAEGREHEIRPCVGMGYCINSIYSGEAVCIHNAATGREATIPHVVAKSDGPKRKVVVVGAGPAGLEAARVAGERGHEVVVFEAAGRARRAGADRRRPQAAARDSGRRRLAPLRMRAASASTSAATPTPRRADVVAENPDVVVVATGGVPNISFLDAGEDLAASTWDILSGAVKPAGRVLLYDDNGAHPGMTAAEFIAEAGSKLEVVTPERTLAPDVGGTNYPAYFRALALAGAKIEINLRLERIERRGNAVAGVFFDEYGKRQVVKEADQIVVDHGAAPVAELYFVLKPGSINLGEIDYKALLANRPQEVVRNPEGRYRLFRIGDAVASRNIHAAVYDAVRLMKDI